MHASQRPILCLSILPAALAAIPFLATNIGQILIHEGSFIHFSKREALMLTALLAFALWAAVAFVLAICAWSARGRPRLYGLAGAVIFAILATAIEPRFWLRFFDLLNDGFGAWIFRTGVVAVALGVVFWRRGSGGHHVR